MAPPLRSRIASLVPKYLRSDGDQLQGIRQPVGSHTGVNKLSSYLIEELNEMRGGEVTRAHDTVSTVIVGAICRVSGIGHWKVIPKANLRRG
jgi:hypothetical protein